MVDSLSDRGYIMHAFLWVALCISAMNIQAVLPAKSNDPKEDLVEKELKQLEGTWRVIKVNYQGKDSEATDILVFSGKKLSLTLGAFPDKNGKPIVQESVISLLDPSKKPKWMDIIRGKEQASVPGIFELDGDKLKIATAINSKKDRPTEFKSKADGSDVVAFYERLKP